MDETIENRRKRLRFRSWHRGTRELDLILGHFADAHLGHMSADQLDRYEALLGNADPEIYRWISGEEYPFANFDFDVIDVIKNFIYRTH